MTKDILLRQVHPAHFPNNTLSSGAFRPTPSDKDQLSVDCGNMTTPELSFELHLKKTRENSDGTIVHLETVGTWGFTRDLCHTENLHVLPDPIVGDNAQPDNIAHHLVDFSSISGANPKKKNDTVAKRLRQQALEIGQLWPIQKQA